MDQPWDNVFIKFNINREAAERLKQLADTGKDSLRNLGILSFQIDKSNVVDLRLDPQFNNNNLNKNDDSDNFLNKTNFNSNNLQLNSFLDISKNDKSQNPTTSTCNENSNNSLNHFLNQNLPVSLEIQQDAFKSPILVKQKSNEDSSTYLNNVNANKANTKASSNIITSNVSINSFNQNKSNVKTLQQNTKPFSTMQPSTSVQTNQINVTPVVENNNFKTIHNFNKSSSSPLSISTNTIQQIQLNYTSVNTPNSTFKNVISIKTPLIRNPNIKLSSNLNQNQVRTFNKKELLNNNSASLNNLGNNVCNSNNVVYNTSASNVALTSPLLVNLLKSDVNENFNSSTTHLSSTSNNSTNTIKEPPAKKIKTKKNRKPKDKPPDAISNTINNNQTSQNYYQKNTTSSAFDTNNLNKRVSSPSSSVQLFENKNLISSTIVNSSIITIPTQVTLSYSSTNIKLENPIYENSKILNNNSSKTYHTTSMAQTPIYNNQNDNHVYSNNNNNSNNNNSNSNNSNSSNSCYSNNINNNINTNINNKIINNINTNININTNNQNIINTSSEITLNNHDQLIYSQQDKHNFSVNPDNELFSILKTVPENNSNSVTLNENQYSSNKASSLKDSSYVMSDSKTYLIQKNKTTFLNLPSPVEENKTNHLINPFTGHMEPMMSEDEEEMCIENIQLVNNCKNQNLDCKNVLNRENNQSSDTDSGICKSTNDGSSQSSSEISPIADLVNSQDYISKLDDKNMLNNKLNRSPILSQNSLTNQKLEIIPNLLADDPQLLDSLTNFTNSSIIEDNALSKNKFVNEMLSMPKDITFLNSKENCDLFFRVKPSRDVDVLTQSDFYLNNSDFNYKNSSKNMPSIDNNQIEEFFNKTDINTLGLNETSNYNQQFRSDLEDVNSLVLDSNSCRTNFENHIDFNISTSENRLNSFKEKSLISSKVYEENKIIGKENNIHIDQSPSSEILSDNQAQYTITFNDSLNAQNFDVLSGNLQFHESITNNNDLLFKINSDSSCELNKNSTALSNDMLDGDEENVRNHSVAAGDHNYTSLKRPCAFVSSESTISTSNISNICSNK